MHYKINIQEKKLKEIRWYHNYVIVMKGHNHLFYTFLLPTECQQYEKSLLLFLDVLHNKKEEGKTRVA